LPFAAALLFLWYDDWKKYKRIGRIILLFIAALFFQLIWVGAVALTEGRITGFIKLALAFTSDHFQEWVGAVTAEHDSLFERFLIFIFYNIIWTGIASQTIFLLIAYVVLVFLLLVKQTKQLSFHIGYS
jgi:4-amino-4-deoxy-L-arabinose transferase-like glycosyltransferase